MQIETADNQGNFTFVHKTKLSKADSQVTFPETKAKVWKFAFRGTPGGHVVLRGLRFLINNEEFYPPPKSKHRQKPGFSLWRLPKRLFLTTMLK